MSPTTDPVRTMLFAVTLLIAGCGEPRQPVQAKPASAKIVAEAKNVLVVMNRKSEESKEIAEYYVRRRGIPKENLLTIACRPSERMPEEEYKRDIEAPIQKHISASRNPIDYIVLTRGIPIGIYLTHYSVDASLAGMALKVEPIPEKGITQTAIRNAVSPYFGKQEKFSSKKFGMYLVTRLTGYSVVDAKKLVDNSLAAQPDKGPFLFDEAQNRVSGDYGAVQATLTLAADLMASKGFKVIHDTTAMFISPKEPLMGYASWGSNDKGYFKEGYTALRFRPGAIGETFVSTSARTFDPADKGQSLVADLIASGITGVKGYFSEPYTFAMARPDILFDRYVKGYNLAESFYMASPVVKWKDIVVGDPLCCPYPRAQK